MSRARRRVAVIGAGAAGLAAMRWLLEAGHDAVAYEARATLGGTWAYEEAADEDPLGQSGSTVACSMYASLRTNLPRSVMSFTGFAFGAEQLGVPSLSRFPGHAVVHAYLRAFAAAFELEPRIRFDRSVRRVRPEGEGWRVEARGGQGGAETDLYDAVAVCNGHYSVPSFPALPGLETFGGRVLHSHSYRRPEPFSGQRVALLGAKASGVDIAFDLSGVAESVHLCGREHVGSEPRGRRGNVLAEPSIRRLHPGVVELADGRRLEGVDALIFCTGYRFDLPFLPEGLVRVEPGYVRPLYRELLHLAHPSLAFIGLPLQVAPFRLFEVQSRFVAAVWSGEVELPDEAARWSWLEAHERALAEAGVARRHWLRHGDRQFAYHDGLARDCGAPLLEAELVQDYLRTRAERRADPEGYRGEAEGEGVAGAEAEGVAEAEAEGMAEAEAEG